jgi:hypothetical protein
MVVDWHNTGSSILAMRLGHAHFAVSCTSHTSHVTHHVTHHTSHVTRHTCYQVRLHDRIEKFFARKCDSSFCVSAAMQVPLAPTSPKIKTLNL